MKSLQSTLLYFVITILLCSPLKTFAAEVSNVKVSVSNSTNVINSIRKSTTRSSWQRIPTVNMKVTVRGFGTYSINISKAKKSDITTYANASGSATNFQELILFEGSVVNNLRLRNSNPNTVVNASVSGAIYKSGSKWLIDATFIAYLGHDANDARMIEVYSSTNGKVRLQKSLGLDSIVGMCASHQVIDSSTATTASATTANATVSVTLKTLKVSTEADYDWYRAYGKNSNLRIAVLLNSAEILYRKQLGVTFKIVKQSVFTSTRNNPYTSKDSEFLLVQFENYAKRKKHLGSANAYLMFTGKKMKYSTIGISYVGVICKSPKYAYGLIGKYKTGFDPITTAHEIGHLFGAVHDDVTYPDTVMATVIKEPLPTEFSQISMNEIGNHLSHYGSCLRNSGVTYSDSSPGLDDGESLNQPKISVSLRGTTLTLAAQSNNDYKSSCKLRVRASTNKNKVTSGKAVVDTYAIRQKLTYKVNISGRTYVRSNRKPRISMYFVAQLNCGEGNDVSSATKRVILTNSYPRSSRTTSQWVSTLRTLIRAQTPAVTN